MARFPLVPTAPEPERVVLVGVEWRDNAWPLDRSLDELERLAHTAGAQCVARLSQRLVKPYPKSFIGSGKVEELCGLVHRMDADVVIFDDDLTPSQQSYLEKAVGEPVKIIDRTVLSQDKLFATLDPTTRSYRLPGGRGMTITDTVGFIQKLPHGLVDAFKSTLSEVLGADLLLKVVDASDEDYERQLEAVDRVLDEIGAGERLTLTVFNKIDLLDSVDRLSFHRRYPEAVLFSAQTGEGLDDLVDRIAREAAATDVLLSADIPYHEGALITLVHEQGTLLHEEYLEEGVRIVAKLSARIAPRLERYRTE